MNTRVIEVDDPLWSQTLARLPHDIYHRSDYLALEGRRVGAHPQAVVVEDAGHVFFLPFLVRDCAEYGEATTKDVVSPYGYPGYITDAAEDAPFVLEAFRSLLAAWREQGVCSAFLRLHPLLNPAPVAIEQLAVSTSQTPTVVVNLEPSLEALWSQTNRKHRAAIRKAERFELQARIVDYTDFLSQFRAIYEETMRRTSATDTYFFSESYFLELAKMGDCTHLMIVEKEQQIVAAIILLTCGGIVQAHLGGSTTEFLTLSPFGLLLHEVRSWAKSEGFQQLHLGGGLGGADDKLLAYKAGFSPERGQFTVARFVVDEEAYRRLLESRAVKLKTSPEDLETSGYFPAYRSEAPK